MTEKRPGPALGVRLIEVSVMRELAVHLTHFTHFIFFFLQQNNLGYGDPQIANLLFEAGQSSTNIGYNI